MAHDENPPAIVRDFSDTDRDVEVLRQPYDGVTFSRGWGDSGYRVEVVDHECPACDFDRMVRRVDVNPETPTEARYWCLYPNCSHFVADQLGYICHNNYPQHPVKEPAVFEKRKA